MNAIQEITLNKCQQKAFDRLNAWADSPEITNLTLEGYAGTGKSTVIGEFVKHRWRNLCVTAPTHKAKKVISRMTGKPSMTIQSLLGLKPNMPDNMLAAFDGSNLEFVQTSEPLMSQYKIVILDEASMINSDLYELMIKEGKKNKVKILFVGDRLQLPPVKEKISKAFTANEVITLDTIVRQEDGNPILKLLATVRNDILNGTIEFKELMQEGDYVNSKGEGYSVVQREVFQTELVKECKQNLIYPDNARFTAWSNDNIKGWNTYIRQNIIENYNEDLTEGEILMAYNTVYDNAGNLWFTNSEEYRVTECERTKNADGYEGYKIKLRNVETEVTTPSLFVIAKEDEPKFFQEFCDRCLMGQRGQGWGQFYGFKRRNLNMTTMQMGKSRNRIVAEKQFDHAYGITVHKTQGSTYKYIFINGKNLNKNSNKEEWLKLWYVALSRCSKKAYITL